MPRPAMRTTKALRVVRMVVTPRMAVRLPVKTLTLLITPYVSQSSPVLQVDNGC